MEATPIHGEWFRQRKWALLLRGWNGGEVVRRKGLSIPNPVISSDSLYQFNTELSLS